MTTIKPEESESEWIQRESMRRVMENPPSNLMSFTAWSICLIGGLAYGYVSTPLIASWVFVSLLMLIHRYRIKTAFAEFLRENDVEGQLKMLKRYNLASNLNAMVWGLTSWLSFVKLPFQNQFVSSITMVLTIVLVIHAISMHSKITNQFIDLLMGTSFVIAVWMIYINPQLNITSNDPLYLIALISGWLIFRVISNQQTRTVRKNLAVEFQNLNLISNLNRQTIQLEQEKLVALHANATIKRFYSSAAHDIRQPVYALKMYSDFVKSDPELAYELSSKITTACDAVNALFNSLFEFEKIDSGSVNISTETVDIAAIFHDLEVIFRPLAEAKQLSMRMHVLPGFIQTDPNLIKGILSHLIMNAIKYTKSEGILVGVRKASDGISFEVWDTGIGIEPSQYTLIFDEFYKVGEPSSADEGFGLGLSVVKRLAAYIEGSSISVHSRVGRGSVFKLKVPLSMYSKPLGY